VTYGKSVVSSTNKNDRHDITEILLKSGVEYHKPNQAHQSRYCIKWSVNISMAVGTGGALGAIAPPPPLSTKQKKNKKKFETQLSNKYNMPYLIMIHCKCDFVLLTQQE
jgi:hypothetical protein